jgi:hypothetical protein
LGTTLLAQQAQAPDLSGRWKVNEQKSNKGAFPTMTTHGILEIKQSGLNLEQKSTICEGNKYSYIIDGKQHESCYVPSSPKHVKTLYFGTAYWDGSTLVIKTLMQAHLGERRDGGITVGDSWTDRLSLSSDGKVLFVTHQPGRGHKWNVVYDKQEP